MGKVLSVLSVLFRGRCQTKTETRNAFLFTKMRRTPLVESQQKLDNSLCHFCQAEPTAVVVRVPAIRRRKASPPQTYCLLHYYTTSAVRLDPKYVTIQDEEELQRQLPAVQEIFSEAYVQLQQELAQESARAFNQHKHDPLAILHDLSKSRKRKPLPPVEKKVDKAAGGFMRKVPLPERMLETQRMQAQKQRELIHRMNSSSGLGNKRKQDLSKRRKTSRKSIWNVVMESQPSKESAQTSIDTTAQEHGAECTCGSKDVSFLGSTSNRNQDLTKGEVWGNKERGEETVTRYQCGRCGRTWDEEG